MASDFTLDFERPLIELEKRIQELRNFVGERQFDVSDELAALEARAERLRDEIFKNLPVPALPVGPASWPPVYTGLHILYIY